MTGRHKSDDFIHQPRRDRMYEEQVKDPFVARGKPPEPTVCPDCSAIFHKGHWQWGTSPADAHEHRCPACSRIHDKVPAGILTLSGDFFKSHKKEIIRMVRHTEEKEKAEHPLERIMNIEEQADEQSTVINFTGLHLAKCTGDALQHAYKGQFDFEYSGRDDALHAAWQR